MSEKISLELTGKNYEEFIDSLIDKIAYKTKQEVMHSLLADIGVDEILKHAITNKIVEGHFDYKELAERWLKQHREHGEGERS